jgi:hypothetical protein
MSLSTLLKSIPGEFQPNQDQLLCDAAYRQLRSCGYRHLSWLRCEVADGVVVLSGRLPSFYLKQVAQTVVQKLDALKGLKNHIQVCELSGA